MCHHTLEPTVLFRWSCRSFHLNFDRFHQPCLLPGRTSRTGEDCRPRTTWRPLTLTGSPALPPLRLTGVFFFATPTGRHHGRMLIHPSPHACATPSIKCLHTRRFGTLASPPPPVQDLPWEQHPRDHLVEEHVGLGGSRSS